MTLYLVSIGDYSDYVVMGVYSTRILAEQARLFYNSKNDIEEFELDALPECPPGLLPYCVVMDEQGDNSTACKSLERESVQGFRAFARPYGDNKHMAFNVWATDEQHARKIANEQRALLIATGRWTTDWKKWIYERTQETL